MSIAAIDTSLIAIVDDDPSMRLLMRVALEEQGFLVTEARDAAEALRIYESEHPSLLIIDVVMPGMDGFDLCRALRGLPGAAHVPILMTTGLDDVASIEKAYDAGATDFIAKPINWLILGHRARYMLRASRALAELREAKEAAEAGNRTKTEFLANMSHELRTPLNAVLGFATLIEQEAFGPLGHSKYREYAADIGRSGSHLLAIINDILDFAKSESHRLELREERVELGEVVRFASGLVRQMARDSGVELLIESADELPALNADSSKLAQILTNLLSNAVKFTPRGGNVSLRFGQGPGGEITLTVADTGIGIPADKMALALTPFGQVDSGLARKYEGTGLGLPLTKRLVELHGGTLELASEPRRGTAVTVRLPSTRRVA